MGEHHANPLGNGSRSPNACYIVSRMLRFASGHITNEPMRVFGSETDAKAYMAAKGEEWNRVQTAMAPALQAMGIVALGFGYAQSHYERGAGLIGPEGANWFQRSG